MIKLTPHSSNNCLKTSVYVSYSIIKETIVIDFNVVTPKLCTSSDFSIDSYSNWQLWDFDVTEVFISRGLCNSYLELQVSPLGQKFSLLIHKPREITEEFTPLLSKIEAFKTDDGFSSKFMINVADIPGKGNDIYANFFACLGDSENRNYFGYKLKQVGSPDFHQPSLFQKLGTI